jgi:hypothetical protein
MQNPDFKEDRTAARDDGVSKKKGWFSSKSPSIIPNEKVSRPPSYSSFASGHGKTGSMDKRLAQDDDLPSREESLPSFQAYSSTAESMAPTENVAGAMNLPSRAGFDLDAIKNVLRTRETDNIDQSGDCATSPKTSGPVLQSHSPVQRNESPTPVATQSSQFATQEPLQPIKLPAEDESEFAAGPSHPTGSFPRPLSVSDMEKSDDILRSPGTNTPTIISNPSLPSISQLTLSSYDASTWPLSSSSDFSMTTQSLGGYLQRSDFGSSKTGTLSFGDASGSWVPSKPYPSPLIVDPFAPTSTSSPESSDDATADSLATRSFTTEKNRWKMIPDASKRSTHVPSSNPWS